jgi:hypothetical protein
MPPLPVGAGDAEAALSIAAVCGAVWAKLVAGNRDSATRAMKMVERICYDFRLTKIDA